jgi:hypothetical protein
MFLSDLVVIIGFCKQIRSKFLRISLTYIKGALVDVQHFDQGQGAQLLLNYLNKARLGSYS